MHEALIWIKDFAGFLKKREPAYCMRNKMKRFLAFILAVIMICLSLVACKKDKDDTDAEKNNEETEDTVLTSVDFLNDDLSEYVEIDEKYYKGYTVSYDPNCVSELDVGNKIIQILYEYKSAEKVDGDGIISAGDTVHIYYKGYYIKDGEPYYFSGGDNTSSSSPHQLGIGSGGFIPGFEYNLIGKDPAEYTEEDPIVVETFFPENYQSSELAGKTAYFEVTVVEIEEYDVPALDETFIKETLGLSEEELAGYEGETLTEKYTAYLREQIMIDEGLDVESLAIDAFWDSAIAGAVVKKYPEQQVKDTYDSILAELESYYYYYYSVYYEYDDFMCLYLGMSVGSDWQSYLTEIAKAQVKQQLLFYHIMNVEGLKPTAEEYEELFDEYLVSALAENGITLESCGSAEKFDESKQSYKTQLIEKNGEEYFKSMIYYQVTMDAIISYANVVEVTE